jgi:hypothetical protein
VDKGHVLLPKPFTMEDLQTKVAEVLEQATHTKAGG